MNRPQSGRLLAWVVPSPVWGLSRLIKADQGWGGWDFKFQISHFRWEGQGRVGVLCVQGNFCWLDDFGLLRVIDPLSGGEGESRLIKVGRVGNDQ
jgi:hypothetical protein